jgi:trigger factor
MENQKEAKDISIEVEDISSVKKRLTVTVPPGDVKEEIDSAYRTLKTTAAVAGFRKGAVPKHILKARYGESVTGDVAARIVETTYPEVLRSKGLTAVDSPSIDMDIKDLREDQPFSYSVTVEVNPEVSIDGYMGLELKKEEVEVTDKDVEEGLKQLQEANTEFKEVESAAGDGDLVVVDFEGSIDGVPIEKSKAGDYPIIIGQSTPLPGMDTAVKGLKKGESKEAKITYPENFSDKEVAGKEALFNITVKTVKEKVPPAIDDEFAKDLEYGSLDELKAKVTEEVKKVKENHAKERLKNEILDKIIEAHPFDVPEALVNRYHSVILNNVIQNMKSGVVNPEDRSLNPEELKAKYRIEAVRRVKEDIVLDSISEKEKVEVSKEETETALKGLAESRGVSFDSLMARIQREGSLDVIVDGLKHEKVFDIIIESSKSPAG